MADRMTTVLTRLLPTLIAAVTWAAPVGMTSEPDDKAKVGKGSMTPAIAGVSLELKLSAKKDTYVLDLGGKSEEDFRKLLKELADAQAKSPDKDLAAKVPPAPKVDLMLELRNTGKEKVTFLFRRRAFYYSKATPEERLARGLMGIELKGPAAVNLAPAKTSPPLPDAEGYGGIDLLPGKSFSWPVQSLNYNRQYGAYWLQPGEYVLRLKLQAAVGEAPSGRFTPVTITSNSIELKIKKEK
jgi:hypothetical protein